jgi:hypothetical protein
MKKFARYTTGLMISPDRTISAMNDLFYAYNDEVDRWYRQILASRSSA